MTMWHASESKEPLPQMERNNFAMSMEGRQNPACFDDYRKELWSGLKLSHEQFDKAVLTMSAGGLAISLTLVKDLFTVGKMVYPQVLTLSWLLFCGAIIFTIISFLTSQKSITVQIDNFEMFAAGDETYWNKPNPYTQATLWLNRISGTCFLLAVISMTGFAAINFNVRCTMSKKTEDFQKGVVTPTMPLRGQVTNGALPPRIPATATQTPIQNPPQQPPTNKK